jgi:arginine exporter protein ArgO
MNHRLYTALVVVLCAAVAGLIWLVSSLTFMEAFMTTLGLAVLVMAVGLLRDNPPSSRRVRLRSRPAPQQANASARPDDAGPDQEGAARE